MADYNLSLSRSLERASGVRAPQRRAVGARVPSVSVTYTSLQPLIAGGGLGSHTRDLIRVTRHSSSRSQTADTSRAGGALGYTKFSGEGVQFLEVSAIVRGGVMDAVAS